LNTLSKRLAARSEAEKEVRRRRREEKEFRGVRFAAALKKFGDRLNVDAQFLWWAKERSA
jgi:hypothetical protein